MSSPSSEERRRRWTDALVLPEQSSLKESMVRELSTYLGLPADQVSERRRTTVEDLAREWRKAGPATPDEVEEFYRRQDGYLYDLTRWHSLEGDDSALAQVGALEVAKAHRARTALDFGSGIGSLGLLLAGHGLRVTLADVNPTLNDYARWRFARRGMQARFLDVGPEALPEGTFDFVAAVDVLEHLHDPVTALKKLAAALRPGGALFLRLPPAEPDPQRPMHLWHDHSTLLGRLEEAGLWLEGVKDDLGLVLRRGAAPVYARNADIELQSTGRGGGWLLSARPLIAIPLNQRAFALISSLDRPRTASNLAALVNVPLTEAVPFLESFGERRLLAKRPSAPEEWPSVTVVVPARDRPERTRLCVESLLALDYPPERLEVLVVDDASEPPLAEALAGLPVRAPRLEKNAGQSAARNLGVAEAGGEVVAFVDNDCVADRLWLRDLVAWLFEPGVDFVGGRVGSPPAEGALAAFEAARSPLDMGESGGEVGVRSPVTYLPACNLAAHREALVELGGFEDGMEVGEDADLIYRALSYARRVRYEPAGRVVHHHRMRPGALLRRRADYGASEADLQSRHPWTRRTINATKAGAALLAALAASPSSPAAGAALAVLSAALVGAEILQKSRKLARAGAPVPARRVAGAVLRQHGSGLYHLGRSVTRYYSLPLAGACLFSPAFRLPTLLLMLIPPAVEHRRLRPPLTLATFAGLYWLELAAYQVGVWRGCLKLRTLRPLLFTMRLGPAGRTGDV